MRTAGWLLDADPGAAVSAQDSGGARFYNREATAAPLPACLHAAAISGRSMAAVLGWLRAGVAGLDEPREILRGHGASGVADVIAGVQELDERPRSLLLMSAAQLLDVYRFPSVQEADRPGSIRRNSCTAGRCTSSPRRLSKTASLPCSAPCWDPS